MELVAVIVPRSHPFFWLTISFIIMISIVSSRINDNKIQQVF